MARSRPLSLSITMQLPTMTSQRAERRLKAQRDEKHYREVAKWFAERRRAYECRAMPVFMGHIPAREVRG